MIAAASKESLANKLVILRRAIADMQSAVVAYSGGIDSTLVLKVAYEELAERALGITALSPTFPAVERDVASEVARAIGVRHELVQTDQLAYPEFVKNDATRCFHCKTDLYRLMESIRKAHAFQCVADGTNLDDLDDDRPGIQAARDWKVRSPLVDAGFTKSDVREAARQLGLSNWDKPAAACLSSRIPRNTLISNEKLRRIEQAEAFLQAEGFRQLRVRDHGDIARIELAPDEFARMEVPELRDRISLHLRTLGFRFVCVDLEGYRPGGRSRSRPARDSA